MLDPAAIEKVDELRAQIRELVVRQSLLRPRSRHRSVARLELELHAAVRRHAGWGPAQHVSVLGLKRRECRAVGAREAQFRIGRANGREMELRALLEQWARPPAAAGSGATSSIWRRSRQNFPWPITDSMPGVRRAPAGRGSI